MNITIPLIASSAIAAAFIHIIMPIHWMPFVAVAKTQAWTKRTVLFFASMSALIHVSFSLILGIIAFLIGERLVADIGGNIETFLIGVLVAYGLYLVIKGYRHHRACPTHDAINRNKFDTTGWMLSILLGLHPCFLIFPITVAACNQGIGALITVAISFYLTTTITLLILTGVGFDLSKRVNKYRFSLYSDTISGLLLTGVGVLMLVFD